MATMVRGQFSQLQAPGLHDLFVHWLNMRQRDEEFSHIFHMDTMGEAPYADEAEFAAGVGGMPLKNEGQSLTYTEAIQGAIYRYEPLMYGQGYRSSFELYE